MCFLLLKSAEESSPIMAFPTQNQPKVEATVRTQNVDNSPTHQAQDEEEEQNYSYYSSSIGTIVALNEPQTHHIAQKYPPGYRFCPFDHELIHYLKLKVADQPLPDDMFKDVNLYSHNPDYFTERHGPLGEREWYFFTPRDRKYLKGSRPSRKAGYGYWKATGADKPIKLNGNTIGYKKSLVFYLGKPPKGDKTDWIMHEFRLNAPPRRRKNANDMRLDDWVLCRVYKKHRKSNKAKQDHPDDLNNYSVPAVALSDENAPCVNNDNNVAEMNWDYNNSIGESNQLIINSCNDFFGSASLDELGMHHFTDPYPTSSHTQSPFQNEFLQTPPQFTDYASLPNFSMPPQQPTTSFNYGSRTNASTIPFMSRYREKEDNGWDSRTRKPQEDDTWSFGKLHKHVGLNDFAFSNYVDPYPSVDNLQLNNAPGSPSLPKSM
ncbi:unnamed protein product [Camellia sinensis]